MTILVIGATGTLGRHMVYELLNAGYSVRCLVRNIRGAHFLSDWGANLVYGDLTLPETLSNTLKGITTIIDLATLRPNDETTTISQIDLVGKLALIKIAKISKIKNFIFFSINDNKNDYQIPLILLKKKLETTLRLSNISYIIFKISGFYQGIISNYALSLLEQQTIYIPKNSSLISFLDSRDIAKICTKIIIQNKDKDSTIISLHGIKKWNSNNIIDLCEKISGQSAKRSIIPLIILNLLKQLMRFLKWTWKIYDYLSFIALVQNDNKQKINKNNENVLVNNLHLKLTSFRIIPLENYLEDYFDNILKKLQDINIPEMSNFKDLTF